VIRLHTPYVTLLASNPLYLPQIFRKTIGMKATKIKKVEPIFWDHRLLVKVYCEERKVDIGEGCASSLLA